jgi:hypothetical protein
MEPTFVTPPALRAVLAELKRREPLFHTPEFGSTRAAYAELLDADFWEVGASGRRYSREYVLDILGTRAPDVNEDAWETHDFHVREIAAEHFLITYTLLQGSRITRRTTLWRRTGNRFVALYHQGTLVDSAI